MLQRSTFIKHALLGCGVLAPLAWWSFTEHVGGYFVETVSSDTIKGYYSLSLLMTTLSFVLLSLKKHWSVRTVLLLLAVCFLLLTMLSGVSSMCGEPPRQVQLGKVFSAPAPVPTIASAQNSSSCG